MPDNDITLDQQLALKVAATRLVDEFSATFGVETIERFLHSSYDDFAGRASMVGFLLCWPSGSLANAFTPCSRSSIPRSMGAPS
jgi:hypothetical protein